ncbi:LON peptidase substrate-binding domain-containing protein [Amnibacterium kyonggiense]
MTAIPMFPLGSVLLPHMPLPLRVFEPRYLAMLRDILPDEPAEFGVTLIERGQEVGGGDVRTDIGTVAQVGSLDTSGEAVLLIAQGVRRIRVDRWLEDAPYPRAEVTDLEEPAWSDDLSPLLARADQLVRRVLKLAEEAGRSSAGRRTSCSTTTPRPPRGSSRRSRPSVPSTSSTCCARPRSSGSCPARSTWSRTRRPSTASDPRSGPMRARAGDPGAEVGAGSVA